MSNANSSRPQPIDLSDRLDRLWVKPGAIQASLIGRGGRKLPDPSPVMLRSTPIDLPSFAEMLRSQEDLINQGILMPQEVREIWGFDRARREGDRTIVRLRDSSDSGNSVTVQDWRHEMVLDNEFVSEMRECMTQVEQPEVLFMSEGAAAHLMRLYDEQMDGRLNPIRSLSCGYFFSGEDEPIDSDRPDEMQQRAIAAGYTELFWQEGRWWGFAPNGVMPTPLDQFISLSKEGGYGDGTG